MTATSYAPHALWFHNPRGVHGPAHCARVFVLADFIASLRGDCDREVLRWAAAHHDIGRCHDGDDTEHGMYSAAQFLAYVAPAALTPAQQGLAAYAITWHVPDDEDAPTITPELRVLKDADALDRVRFGSHVDGLDPRYLRTPEARRLVPLAEALYSATRNGSWADVRRAARELGVWPCQLRRRLQAVA